MAENGLVLKLTLGGEIRRMRMSPQSKPHTLDEVRGAVGKLFKAQLAGRSFHLSYIDEDEDEIRVTAEIEFQEAVFFARKRSLVQPPTVRLIVSVGDSACVEPMLAMSAIAEEVKEDAEEVTEEAGAEAEVPDPAPAEAASKGKEVDDAAEEVNRYSEDVGEVPLDSIVDRKVYTHPFFVRLVEDFQEFTQNLRSSIPPNFSDKIRNHLVDTANEIEAPLRDFVDRLREGGEDVHVPRSWKDNSFITYMNQHFRNAQGSAEARMARWEAARTQLAEMGYSQHVFFNNVLIVSRDGDMQQVVEDLLSMEDRNAKMNATYESMTFSLVELFQQVGQRTASLMAQSVASMNQIGLQLTEELKKHEESIAVLQGEVDKQVKYLQEGARHASQATRTTSDAFQKGFEEQMRNTAEVWNSSLERTRSLLHEADVSLSSASQSMCANSVHLLRQAVFSLNGAILQANASLAGSGAEAPEQVVTCSNCERVIEGVRYKCATCNSYDLCVPCEEQFDSIHDVSHILLKMRPHPSVVQSAHLSESCVDSLRSSVGSSRDASAASTPARAEEAEEVSVSDFVQVESPVEEEKPVQEPAPVEEKYDERTRSALKTLQLMGFNDEEQIVALLQYYNYDVEATLEVLLQQAS